MLPLILVLVCTLSRVSATSVANQYFDTVLNVPLQNEIRVLNLDPLQIGNIDQHFKDKVVFINVKGNANYTDGNMTGLSHPKRHSECMGPSYAFGGVHTNCTFSFNDLKTSYSGKLKYGKLPVVSFKAKAKLGETLVFVEVTGSPPSYVPVVKNLSLTVLGKISTEFKGLGVLSKQLDFMDDGFKDSVKKKVYNAIEKQFGYAFSRAVTQVMIPRL